MRRCPKCGKVYSDPDINFCLNDGELLSRTVENLEEEPKTLFADDSPDTLLLDHTRVTNPISFPAGAVMPQTQHHQAPVFQQPQYGIMQTGYSNPNTTLPVISLILAISSVLLICCLSGIYMGLPAAILGWIGMTNANKDPMRFGGGGMAITAMVIGIITFIISIFHLFISIVAN